jgi:hypothetical protein
MPVDYVFPPSDGPIDPAWIEPLEAVASAIAGDPLYRFFDTDDFMIMARLIRRPRPSIVLYKHYYTRRYLNLDDAGHAYRYIGARDANSQSDGRYVAHKDLRVALNHLELWDLPWMKPGLEQYRSRSNWYEPEQGGGDGDLHMV